MSWDSREKSFAAALLGSSLISFALYVIGAQYYGAGPLWFLNWNLILAWVPLFLSTTLVHYLKKSPWVSAYGIILSIVWLLFIPNSFYLVTDLIHIAYYGSENNVYYAVMLFSFALNGLILGFTSLYQVHNAMLKRIEKLTAHYIVTGVLLLCSFAIYLGRVLRWSTWDVVANPAGILFDVSDQIVNPVAHGQTFQITFLVFVLLGSFYILAWKMLNLLTKPGK